jgi:MFS family permease
LQINVLFPFLVFMIEDFGHTGKELGYYAGGDLKAPNTSEITILRTGGLAASFCAAQFVSSVFWGRFSDKFGRKLALLLGCVGAAAAGWVTPRWIMCD